MRAKETAGEKLKETEIRERNGERCKTRPASIQKQRRRFAV
jgi:hypothetical protein